VTPAYRHLSAAAEAGLITGDNMKNRLYILISLMFLFLLFPAGVRAQKATADFSADIISTTAQGAMNMKIYSTTGKSRVEMPGNIMIIRQDFGVMWMVMPDQNMYMERPIDYAMLARTSPVLERAIERVPMGNESIDGVVAQKSKITYEVNGRPDSMYQWIGPKDMPIRSQAIDGSWTVDYKNISMGPQPDSLFEPPAGYQKMAIPSMGDMVQAMQNGS